MRSLVTVLAAVLCMAAVAGHAAEPATPLIIERTIALKHVSGRIDHLAIDLGRKRLFVAELGNGTIDVIDLASASVLRRIEGLKEPQGVAYAPAADVLAVASAGDGSVRLYRGENLTPAGRIDLGDDADNIRLDARTGNLVVGYGSGGLAVIDPAKALPVNRIPLPAHPEGFRLDPERHRAFVNVPDAHQIAVVDLEAGRRIGTWQLPGLRGNFPMAWDQADRVIAVVYRDPPRLALIDNETGAVRQQQETCGDADDVFFDSRRRRIYISCGSGAVDVFNGDDGTYHHSTRVLTKSGARTSLFVPEVDRLFVAVRAGLISSQANLLVFRPEP